MADQSYLPNSQASDGEAGGDHRAADAAGLDGPVLRQPVHAVRSYAPPQLVRYGRLAELTANGAPKGKNDHGAGRRRTGF